MAAISGGGPETLLIEGGPKPGRKLLTTAAGQCNFTHEGTVPELLARYNGKERFLRPALFSFTNENLIAFFNERGIPSFVDEKGRYLPRSLSARDILHALINEAREKGTRFHQNDRVISVEKTDSGFRVITKLKEFSCEKLIIATGGRSFPKTGSTGEGARFARELGHSIVPLRPALTGVESDVFTLTSLAGLSFEEAGVEVFRQGKLAGRYKGNLLITHKGLSGPVVIDNSRDFREGDRLNLNFCGQNREKVNQKWSEELKEEGKQGIGSFMKNLGLPRKLIGELLGVIPPEKSLSQMTKGERKKLLGEMTEYPFSLDRLQGWNKAMVTTGGVETKEINPKTMESRLVPGLYFAGEVMDIDGDSGGFNLQAAFSTGFLAGMSLRKSVKE